GKIPLNRSYYDTSSTRFFAERSLTARGHLDPNGRYVARMLWPEAFTLRATPPMRAFATHLRPGRALRELMREEPHGGAQSPFAAFTLWRKASMPDDWR